MQKVDFLKYLNGLNGQTLSGQHLPEWESASAAWGQLITPLLAEPAIIGYTILTGQSDTYMYWSLAQSVLKAHLDKGGVVLLDIHPPDPWASTQNITSAWVQNQQAPKNDLTSLLSGNSLQAQRWTNIKSELNSFLSQLPSTGNIIFRPLHEAVGIHFWWGMDLTNKARSEAGVKALWLDLYNTFAVKYPQIIWGFAAGMSWYGPLSYGFPGKPQVDIVGASLYSDSLTFPNQFNDDYATLTSFGLPTILFECGSSSMSTSWSAMTIASALQRYPKLLAFQEWQDYYALANVQNSAQLLALPNVLTLIDLPSAPVTPTPPPPPSVQPNIWVAVNSSGKVLGVASSQAKAQAAFPGSVVSGFVEVV